MDYSDIPYADRHHVENLADLYAVIVAIERVEKAFHRDLLTTETYEATLRRLLSKYKAMVSQLEGESLPSASSSTSPSRGAFDMDRFWTDYVSKCSAARQRIRLGHPADVKESEQAAALASSQQAAEATRAKRMDPKLVLECGQHFITLMDCLKLQQTAVDQLFPILNDLVHALQRFPNAKDVLPFLSKLEGWTQRLTGMHPSDELSERDTRELAFDLERGYQSFYHFCSTQNQA